MEGMTMLEESPLSGKLVLHICNQNVFIFESEADEMLCRAVGDIKFRRYVRTINLFFQQHITKSLSYNANKQANLCVNSVCVCTNLEQHDMSCLVH